MNIVLSAKTRSGFTLIELMITLAVLAILAALAFANYSRYAFRARRNDGRELVMRAAAAQERYYTTFNQYTNNSAAFGTLTPTPYYTLSTTTPAGGQGYTLTATPQGAQASDTCGSLTLTDTGVKGSSNNTSNGPCW